ncbi:MAG TPA: tetratricopeptide repeat protein, partial [Thermoanaerobaculia bacterium]|nr:tetratricopeptide repeat protein [Thermoanaerobaculia bacterium]
MGPLGVLFLAGALTLDPAQAELTARSFGEALRADDVRAFATLTGEPLPQGAGWKSVLELIEHFDEVTITATRVAASPVPTVAGASLLTVEVTGSGVTAGQRRVRVLPRWWSLELRAAEDGPRVTSALTLERRLAQDLATATAERLDAFLGEHSELDTERFLMELADTACEHGEAGHTAVSWALAQARLRHLPRAEGGVLESLSLLPMFGGSPAAMVAPAEEGVDIATRRGDADVLAGNLFALAVAYWFNDRTDEAIATFKRIGTLAEAVEQPGTVLRAVHMAAYLEVDAGRLREALETAQRQAGMLARHPLPRPAIDAAFMAGDIHAALGNLAVSRREYERALALAAAIGNRQLQAMALTNIAWIASESGDTSEAERLLGRALTVGQGAMETWDEATMLIELGNVLLREGKLPEAETRLQQGAEIAKGTSESLVLAAAELGLSELNVRAGRAAQALSLARDARQRLQLLDAPTRASKQGLAVWRAVAAEGRAELASGSAERAEASWRQAVELLESSRQELPLDAGEQADRFAEALPPYRDLLDLLVAQKRPREALQVAEQMRARALRDTLVSGRVDLSSTVAPADRAREDELEQSLERLNLVALGSGPETQAKAVAARDDARLALQRFQGELYLRHPDLSRRRAPAIADALELAEAVIPPRGAV